MRPPSHRRVAAALTAAAAALIVLAPTAARAMPQPRPPRGPIPPCASGPGGLIGCIPSPGDLLSGAARTAGDSAMKVFTVFFTDGAKWFLERLQELVTAPTRPDLSVDWWVERYNMMLALAAVVAAATFLLALIDDAAKGSPEGLGRTVLVDVPVAGLVGGVAPPVIQYLVNLADWLTGRLLRDLGVDSAKTLSGSAEWFQAFATGSQAIPAVAALIAALLTILAAFVIFLELLLRANAIYLIAALIPVMYAIRIWPAAKTVARRTTEALLAIVFVQPVVGLAIGMGAGASAALGGIGDTTFREFGAAIAGATMLLLAALAPWAFIALMPALEGAISHGRGQRDAVRGGLRSGLQTAYTGTYLGRLAAAGGHRGGAGQAGAGGAGTAAARAGWGIPAAAAVAQGAGQVGREAATRQERQGATASSQTSPAAGSPPPSGGAAGSPPGAPPGQPGQQGSRRAEGRPGPEGRPGSAGPSGSGPQRGPRP